MYRIAPYVTLAMLGCSEATPSTVLLEDPDTTQIEELQRVTEEADETTRCLEAFLRDSIEKEENDNLRDWEQPSIEDYVLDGCVRQAPLTE